MELINALRIIARWFWLVVLIVGATVGLLYLTQRGANTVYESTITLEITQPDPETVALYDEYNYRSQRDQIVISLNKFIEVAQYDTVIQRTMDRLGLSESYDLTVDTELGADFVYMTVAANSPERAQEIARTHAQVAVEHFGELRTQPLIQVLSYFDLEVAEALSEIREAEQALLAFSQEHGFISIEDELAIQNNVLNELVVLKWLGGQSGPSTLPSNNEWDITDILAASEGLSESDKLALDQLIENQRQRLITLAQLEPEYYALQKDIELAREKYDTLATKQTEANLKASFAGQAFFIQVIDDATRPTSPAGNIQALFFGVAGSLGLSIVIVFVLDYIKEKSRSSSETGRESNGWVVPTEEEAHRLRTDDIQTHDAFQLK